MNFVPVTSPPEHGLIRSVEELASDARIVILGEELHGDGATFAAKARLAEVLFERCGFDTMAWESPVYDVGSMDTLDRTAPLDDLAATGLFPIWHGEEIEPLLQYCRDHDIAHRGVDCQLLSDASRSRVAADISRWAAESGTDLTEDAVLAFVEGRDDSLEPDLDRLVLDFSERTDSWASMVTANVLADRRQERIGRPVYGPYVEASKRGEIVELDPFDPIVIAANSARDEAMGINAVRLVEEGRRVVLWAANFHALRALGRIEPYATRAPGVRTMGDHLHDHLGDAVKVVVGTSTRGSRWDLTTWAETAIDERLADAAERGWPPGTTPHLALVGPDHDVLGPIHLVGVGPMRLHRPADHFDAVLHVEVQRPPRYTRW